LVGRLDEQTVLARWLGESIAGTPRIVIVRGEPGMGKTTLLRWLLDEARSSGALTAWGAAVEGVDVPMLAAAPLMASIPGGTAALAPDASTPGPWEGSGSRRLTRAVEAVVRAGERGSVVLVIDDVQWADEATLALVQHLAVVIGTSAKPLSLLLAVTVRAGEGAEPGRRTVHRLAREPLSRQLHVGPLDEVEVREFCRDVTGEYPSRTELRTLIDVTGGSPLLIRARMSSSPGSRAPADANDAGLDLLEGRYARLPRATRRAVDSLAVLGGTVTVDALDALLGVEHPQLLGPALDTELVAFDGDVLVFEHSLYRHAVLQSMGADRARAVTVDIAERVAAEPLRSMLAPGVVAAQLRLAPDAAPADVIATINWRAGIDAHDAGAWGLAADHFEAALLADERAEQPWTDRAHRWYLTGEAAFRDHNPRCVDHLRRALDLADGNLDLEVVATATILRARGLLTLGSEALTAQDEAALLALANDPDPRLDRWRSALLAMAAECRFATFDVTRGAELAARARSAASRSADPLSTWAVEIAEGLQHVAALRLDDAASCFRRAVETSASADSRWHEASSRHRVALIEVMRGDLDGADRSIADGMDVARSCHHWAECSFGGGLRTITLAARGDPRVEAEAEAAAAMFRRTSYAFSPGLLYPALAYGRATRGDIDGAREALVELESVGQRTGSHRRALARFDRVFGGSVDVAPRRSRSAHRTPDLSTLAALGSAADEAIDFGDRAEIAALVGPIDEVLAAGVSISPGWPHFFPRIRAEVAAASGETNARDRLDEAMEQAEREGLQYELILLELLASRVVDDRVKAVEHAAAALRRADAAGMLTGVVISQDRLHQLGSGPGRPIARAVLTTDIVSSTDLTRTLGDDTWLKVLGEHDALVMATVRRHGGVIFKHTGDGMFAWFATPSDAVRATEVLLGEFEHGRLHNGLVPMRIRAGVALGSPLSRDDGDLFGMTVIEAARLCSAAGPGTGLASAAVAAAAERPLTAFGRLDLKGFDAAVETFVVEPVSD
jgi:class 3 adenylate cyclase